jgi:L-alanine-DL-glutamate epimerase-like enolase superfamily enzyme
MRLSYQSRTLHLLHPFILSGSRIDTKDVIIVRIEHDGITGLGESSPSRYYGEPPESALNCLSEAQEQFKNYDDPFQIEEIARILAERFPNNPSARSGVDMALHDWIGKKLNQPLYQYFGLGKNKTPRTSFTIGIDELNIMEKKIREAEAYPILKIKLGVGEKDFEIVKTIRKATDKILRVDVNEGWTRDEAAEKIEWLAKQGVELIEQPLPKENLDGMAWLKPRSPLPLFADENVRTGEDIPQLKDCFHGVNIKLDKCGGLMEARRMIGIAREYGLKTMLGCMIQTAVGITAAAHLSPLVDFADLDGHLLIRDEPFTGIAITNGKIILNERPGIGILI